MLATVKKIGGSMAIVIPKSMAAHNQLSPGTAVDLSQGEDGIVNNILSLIDPVFTSVVKE